jgi:hypothetical protein
MFVYGGILLYIGIGLRHISFRLIVIVVADEILNRVMGKKVFELAVKLRGEGFVGSDNKGWFLDSRYHIGNSKGLSGSNEETSSKILFLANLSLTPPPLSNAYGEIVINL